MLLAVDVMQGLLMLTVTCEGVHRDMAELTSSNDAESEGGGEGGSRGELADGDQLYRRGDAGGLTLHSFR